MQVVSIVLDSNQLAGPLPVSVGNMTALRWDVQQRVLLSSHPFTIAKQRHLILFLTLEPCASVAQRAVVVQQPRLGHVSADGVQSCQPSVRYTSFPCQCVLL